MTIRQITQEELKKYLTIVRAKQKNNNSLNMLHSGVYRDAIDKGEIYMMFNKDGDALGLLFYHLLKREPTIKIEQIASVESGHGIGKKLFQYAHAIGIAHHCNKIKLYVRRDNNNAISFYEYMGMERIGEKEITYIYEMEI
jgi:hypothetical protein